MYIPVLQGHDGSVRTCHYDDSVQNDSGRPDEYIFLCCEHVSRRMGYHVATIALARRDIYTQRYINIVLSIYNVAGCV
jgi:hypothetical protein